MNDLQVKHLKDELKECKELISEYENTISRRDESIKLWKGKYQTLKKRVVNLTTDLTK